MGDSELIVGAPAIAEFLGGEVNQVYYMAPRGHLPIFKIGNRWSMRKSAYEKHCFEREQAAMAEA